MRIILSDSMLDEPLADRLRQHLNTLDDFQNSLEYVLPAETRRKMNDLISDARGLALQISLIPHFEKYEPLVQARRVLAEYWHSTWSNSGISEREYKTRLKAAILFIQAQHYAISPDFSPSPPSESSAHPPL